MIPQQAQVSDLDCLLEEFDEESVAQVSVHELIPVITRNIVQ